MCEDMLPHGKPRPVQLRMMRSIEILVLLLELVVVAYCCTLDCFELNLAALPLLG